MSNISQEDAHITNPNFAEGIGLFAVFDGHGGLECAKFCEKYFEQKLKDQPEFQSRKDYGKAFENTFLGLDKMLFTQQGLDAMIAISKAHPN